MKNIETLIKKMIDIHVKGIDSYVNNGSLWLIFTEEKKWVIELEKDGILWYNYNFFSKIFKLISMNVADNEHYITRWVEDILQNGAKRTVPSRYPRPRKVEDILQNGAKRTNRVLYQQTSLVEDILQNGVKYTETFQSNRLKCVEDILQNGVKRTWLLSLKNNRKVEDTIQNGVKETYDDVYHHKGRVDGVIKNGIKEVQPLPAQDGNRDWGNYYHRQKDRTKPHTQYVDDVIENSIKEKL